MFELNRREKERTVHGQRPLRTKLDAGHAALYDRNPRGHAGLVDVA